MAKQKTNDNVYIAIITVLTVVIIAGGAYFLFFQKKGDGEENTISGPTVADITDDTDATTFTKDTPLGQLECVKDQKPDADYCKIDSSKILNARKGTAYTLTELSKEDSQASDFEKLATIKIDEKDGKEAKITFNKEIVKRYYGIDNYSYTITVPFSRKAVSAKIAGFGQGVGDEYIFFLMEDGTIDMLSVYSMLNDKKYDPFVIKGVSDVTVILGGSSYGEYAGGHTNFAVRKDKTAYDLQTLLPNWGER